MVSAAVAGHPRSSPADAAIRAAWTVLEGVMDPEIPVISVVDLGIVRHVRDLGPAGLEVGISPTYTGCPATEVIRADVHSALRAAGSRKVTVVNVLSPPWTSDWISDRGREQLRRYGIAPPPKALSDPRSLMFRAPVACPRCDSQHTEKVSEFGSTPCKAHYKCLACAEPFDHFKCI